MPDTPEYLQRPQSSAQPIAHLPHPTRGDGSLCGWLGLVPMTVDKPTRLCAACQSKQAAR